MMAFRVKSLNLRVFLEECERSLSAPGELPVRERGFKNRHDRGWESCD